MTVTGSVATVVLVSVAAVATAIPTKLAQQSDLVVIPGLKPYLGRGYDLACGNPAADGTADPGYLYTQPVFDLDSFEQGRTVTMG